MLVFAMALHKESAPAIVTVTKVKSIYLDRIVTQNTTVLVPVYITKEIEKERLIYPQCKVSFDNMSQMEGILKSRIVAFQPNVCVDIALNLQQVALQQGYIVNLAFAMNHIYYGKYVCREPLGHCGLVVNIAGSWYFVDPEEWMVTQLW